MVGSAGIRETRERCKCTLWFKIYNKGKDDRGMSEFGRDRIQIWEYRKKVKRERGKIDKVFNNG